MHFDTAAFFFFFVCVSIASDGEKDLKSLVLNFGLFAPFVTTLFNTPPRAFT